MNSGPMQVTIHRTGQPITTSGAGHGRCPVSPAVQAEDLMCAGCHDQAVPQPPQGWPSGAGPAPEFSHRDGSVLCPDGRGRIGEPVEARVLESGIPA